MVNPSSNDDTDFVIALEINARKTTREEEAAIRNSELPDAKHLQEACCHPALVSFLKSTLASVYNTRMNLVFLNESMDDAIAQERYLKGQCDILTTLLNLGV